LSHRIQLCAIVVSWLAVPALHAQWINYKIPGVPRTADGKVNLTAPVARSYDGKPDLSGTWHTDRGYFGNLARDLKPGELLMLPWAEERVKEKQSNQHKNDPMVACLPPGVPRANLGGSRGMPHPFKIVQTPALVVFLYETSTNQTFRQVFLDGRPHPTDPQPTWLGYSIGRWDGDTLVVQSSGFRDGGWLDVNGSPFTDKLKLTERFTRLNYGTLRIDITVDDPKAYTKPWTVRITQRLTPEDEMIEFVCNENEQSSRHFGN
jgi:hypothetical protein